MTSISLPFISAYDPVGTSEGTLDPLGLYQIADQLAVQLVPAVRERMQRIRFLSAIAVGAIVVEDLEDDPRHRDASPYLLWEWLVVEALVRSRQAGLDLIAVPGSSVAQHALDRFGYVDARSYLKTPRIFGFTGVYKRLAVHLGILNTTLGAGPVARDLVEAWRRGQGFSPDELKERIARWRQAVLRCQRADPPRTQPAWQRDQWEELAKAFHPGGAKAVERRALSELLVERMAPKLGALPALWDLLSNAGEVWTEEAMLDQLRKCAPQYDALVNAITCYEDFARQLQDGFDRLLSLAQGAGLSGYPVKYAANDAQFRGATRHLERSFAKAHDALAVTALDGLRAEHLFSERFRPFVEPLTGAMVAQRLCEHHLSIQKAKGATGKRPWFDALGEDRLLVRPAYRRPPRENQPDRFVHAYRTAPIHRFMRDLR